MRRVSRYVVTGFWLAASGVLVAGQAAPAPTPAKSPSEYAFRSGAGLLVFHVRPDATQAFEAAMARLAQVLGASIDPTRSQQAKGWRAFRSVESTADAVLYVLVFDPAVATADYDPVRLLSEEVPSEARTFYDTLRAAVLKVERMGLTPLP